MSSGPLRLLGEIVTSCLVLRILLQELKGHCCHRLKCVQILHLDWFSHRRWCFVPEESCSLAIHPTRSRGL